MSCDYVLLNAHYCLLFRRRFGIGRLDSVFGWLVVMHTYLSYFALSLSVFSMLLVAVQCLLTRILSMIAWLTLASLVVMTTVASSVNTGEYRGRQRWSHGSAGPQLDVVLRTKIDELDKLGVTSDDLMRYLWRVGQPPDQSGTPPRPGAVAASLSGVSRTSSAADQRRKSDGNLLVRYFVHNRTVSCNDGSPAGYNKSNQVNLFCHTFTLNCRYMSCNGRSPEKHKVQLAAAYNR